MTAIWSMDSVRSAVAHGRVVLTGDRQLAADMQTGWASVRSPGAQTGQLTRVSARGPDGRFLDCAAR